MTNSSTTRRQSSPRRDYSQRNKLAYAAGKQACADGRIHAGALRTYDHLVKQCGAKDYTDATFPDLAAALGYKHGRTVQQHCAVLRAAGLIDSDDNGCRKIVVALVEDVAAPDVTVLLEAAQRAVAAGEVERAQALSYQASMLLAGGSDHDRDHDRADTSPLGSNAADVPQAAFFSPVEHDPKIMETRSRDHALPLTDPKDPIKEAYASGRAAGISSTSPAQFFRREESATVAELRKHEVAAPSSLAELAGRTVGEVRHVAASLTQRYGVGGWGPGLLVRALKDGLYGRAAPRQAAQERYHETSMGGWAADALEATHTQHSTGDGDPPDDDPPDDGLDLATSAELECIWAATLARIDATPEDRRTWLESTRLLECLDECATVGCANVFVREHVERTYHQALTTALAAELGHDVLVELFISS